VGNEQDRPAELITAVVARLRQLPPSDPRARAAILARVHDRRPSPWRAALAWFWQPSVPAAALVGTAVIAVAAGYTARAVVGPTTAVVSIAPALPELTPVAGGSVQRLVPTQFYLDAPGATEVAIVGAFNDWDPRATPLTPTATRGVWETSVLLPPGRHEYAFIVNGEQWTPDPRAPQVADPDFGRANSVAMVSDQ
jgi:hypothetical protein